MSSWRSYGHSTEVYCKHGYRDTFSVDEANRKVEERNDTESRKIITTGPICQDCTYVKKYWYYTEYNRDKDGWMLLRKVQDGWVLTRECKTCLRNKSEVEKTRLKTEAEVEKNKYRSKLTSENATLRASLEAALMESKKATEAALKAATAAANYASVRSFSSSTFEPKPFPSIGADANEKYGHGEALAALHMRALGFTDASPSGCWNRNEIPNGWNELRAMAIKYVNEKDLGVDIRAANACAQVKSRFSQKTGRPDVAQLVGDTQGLNIQHRLFYAVDYAEDAIRYADEQNVALYVFNDVGNVMPKNNIARDLKQKLAQIQSCSKRMRSEDAVVSSKPVNDWNQAEVAAWLTVKGFAEYIASFEPIEGKDLEDLRLEDLEGLRPPITSPLIRRKMLSAISGLVKGGSREKPDIITFD